MMTSLCACTLLVMSSKDHLPTSDYTKSTALLNKVENVHQTQRTPLLQILPGETCDVWLSLNKQGPLPGKQPQGHNSNGTGKIDCVFCQCFFLRVTGAHQT
jgi:hypothetical protein